MQKYIQKIETNGSTPKENAIIGIVPKHQGYFYDSHGDMGAFILIGYLNEEPVFRTTHTLAYCKDNFWSIKASLTK